MSAEPQEEHPPSVLIVDPLALRRAALRELLQGWAIGHGVTLHGMAPDDIATLQEEGWPCALALLVTGALSLADGAPRDWLRELVAKLPSAPVCIVSDRLAPEEPVAALQAGARGFVPASMEPPMAMHAFTFIMRGGSFFPPSALLARGGRAGGGRGAAPPGAPHGGASPRRAGTLTQREQAILARLGNGEPNKVIARLLGLQEATVKVHMRRIMRKLGATNRTQAALAAVAEPREAA